MRTPTLRTDVERVFDAEQRRLEAVLHVAQYVVLAHVRAALAHADARVEVVELAAVELEELDQQHAQVDLLVLGVEARVQL